MGWLNGWIKELIMIILIAAFADFLLPSQALQRYVRSIIGLFILLVLLSPVFELFHRGWNANQLIGAAFNTQSAKDQSIPPLPEIMLQSDELAARNDKQAKQLLEQQIAMNMKNGIESETSIPVQSVDISTKFDKEGRPSIASVVVVLAEIKEGTAKEAQTSQGSQPSATMKPIEPIHITLPDFSRHDSTSATPKPSVANSKRINQVKQYIAQAWQLKANQMTIQFIK